ncbi:hypothetical protein C7974DRAFT_300742 [Boeremia exigua]|uniref:uncharacterized protein n=1 Tax=Boeremia exigua TaxID=749465 RepID=UPI001E8CB67B|nr:uncharacterized protein C7974DRAFT_300742 [Boeremia exigua]KAH6644782.1 hypothetical protein C7974DRAFT_300742 [Boeremia exigua]
MSALPSLIPVTQKAPNVCGYCRARKQACDRTVPSCLRCAAKGFSCDYSPSPPVPSTTSEPLILRSQSGAPLLSCLGAWKLVHYVTTSLKASSDINASSKLSDYVVDILKLADINLTSIVEDYGRSIRHWSPTVYDCTLDQGTEVILTRYPALALSVWLVTQNIRKHAEHPSDCQLYRVLKQVLALLQTKHDADIEALQLGLSIAVYEVGHGMGTQAFQTILSCKAILTILEHGATAIDDISTLETTEWLKASLIMLDRILFVTSPSPSFTLTIPPSDPICNVEFTQYHPPIMPTHVPSPCTKVHFRTVVALGTGKALDYVNARRRTTQPYESYDAVDMQTSGYIRMLMEDMRPSSWVHCDAIGLGFCSHLLLQEAQVLYLAGLPYSDELRKHIEKANLALRYARRMAWDMVKVSLGKLENEDDVAKLPFAALCCILRAGIAVLETSRICDEQLVSNEEFAMLQRCMRWFSARWHVGVHLEARLEQFINSHT